MTANNDTTAQIQALHDQVAALRQDKQLLRAALSDLEIAANTVAARYKRNPGSRLSAALSNSREALLFTKEQP